MRRRVFIGRGHFKLYPNLFTILVGRPGLGKGSAINPAIRLIQEADVANVLSDRITIEYVLEKLAKGWSSIHPAGTPGNIAVGIDHSCLILSRELSVFVSASQFTLPILTDLWDSIEGSFVYGTRHNGEFKIDSPCVTLLGGSTQEWLLSSIPASAIGGGFTRRVNFVVAHDREQVIPWPIVSKTSPVRQQLVDDLKDIGALVGEFKFSPLAVPMFEKVYTDSVPGYYDDEATTSYKTSKWAQVSKIAMCFSAARGDDLIISKEDFEQAVTAVDNVAANVPRVFRGVGESDMVSATHKVLDFIEQKGYASRQEILRSHWRDVSQEDLTRILATLEEGHIITTKQQGRVMMYTAVEKLNRTGGKP